MFSLLYQASSGDAIVQCGFGEGRGLQFMVWGSYREQHRPGILEAELEEHHSDPFPVLTLPHII